MRKVFSLLPLSAFLTVAFISSALSNPCAAADKQHSLIEQTLVIKAPAKIVFEGIQQSRSDDPERRHMVSHTHDVAIIDEKLANLPVIGTAHLVYKEIEVPYKRIDYLLVSSDKFKAFEGSWELTALENGDTKVSLKSYSEVKVWVPFADKLSSPSTIKDINRRLGNLKHWCDEHERDGRRFAHTHDHNHIAENTAHGLSRCDNSGEEKSAE